MITYTFHVFKLQTIVTLMKVKCVGWNM